MFKHFLNLYTTCVSNLQILRCSVLLVSETNRGLGRDAWTTVYSRITQHSNTQKAEMCRRAGKIRHSQATFPLRLAPHLQAPHNQREAVGLAHREGLAQPPRRGLSLPLCPQGCPSRALLLAFKAPSPHRLRTIALSDTSMHAVEVTYRDGESRWAPF